MKFTGAEGVGEGMGLTATSGYVPAADPKEMVEISCVELMKLAKKLEPLNSTLAPFWKLVPVIVRVGEELAGALVGLIDVIVGGGG